jgi:RNA polymerase sigma factor (sigma-70 family)
MDTVIRHLRRAMLRQDGAGRTDGELLRSFIDQRDEAAFEALVHRHGSMVFGVCRRVVGNHHDAEDAFQATFLVLARKASSVRPAERLANWLHGVALRTAMKAKTMTAKRRVREKQVTEMPESEAAPQDQGRDLQSLLDRELNGLPEKYRLPILLCELEGKTIKEATQQLGWPQGTLAGRLARGRTLLARRLASRGVALSAGALAASGVPASLMNSTANAAALIAAGQALVAGVVPAKVAALMEGVISSMMLTKLKTVTAVLLLVGMAASGVGMLARPTAAAAQVSDTESNEAASPKAASPPKSVDEAKLHGEWICEQDNVHFSIIFGPDKSIRRIIENRDDKADVRGTYSVDWSKTPYHLDFKWGRFPVGKTIMEFTRDGKLRIELGGSADLDVRPKAFSDETWVLTRKEKPRPGSKQANREAERDLATADFYRRARKFGSAYFYYVLVRYRYPDSDQAKKARHALEELEQHRGRRADGSEAWEAETEEEPQQPPPPARMVPDAPTPAASIQVLEGQVRTLEARIKSLESKGVPAPPVKVDRDTPAAAQELHDLKEQVKNLERRVGALEAREKRTGDAERTARVGKILFVDQRRMKPVALKQLTSAILKELPLSPGQVLDSKTLRKAEKKLTAFHATIEILDTDGTDFKDILVTIKTK